MVDRIGSIVFYMLIAVLILCLADNIQKHRREKLSTICLILLLSFVAGFRSLNVGIDTYGYYSIIIQLREGYVDKISNVNEQGFLLLSYILMKFSSSYTLSFCVYALITNTFIILRLKDYIQHISYPCALLVYYMLYYFNTFNTLRQWIAISIVFYFSRYLNGNKKGLIKYIIAVLLATTMHNSALIAVAVVPLYFIFKPSTTKYQFIFKVLLSCLALLSITYIYDYFMGIYGDIYTSISSYGAISFVNIARLIFLILIILYNNDGYITIDQNKDTFNELRYETILYFIGITLTLMVYFYRYADRIGQYYILYETVVLAYFVKNKRTRTFAILFTIFLCGYIRYNSFMVSGYGEIPYIPFWNE